MKCMVFTYYVCHTNGQTHMYLIPSSIKIINKHNVFPCTDSSRQGWFHAETSMHILGL